MAGKAGAFDDALKNMRSTSSDQQTPSPSSTPRSKSTDQTKTKPKRVSEVKRLRAPNPVSRTEPFSQRVDIDVQNVLYAMARKNNWTMNRTLREAAKALAVARGDKNGAGL